MKTTQNPRAAPDADRTIVRLSPVSLKGVLRRERIETINTSTLPASALDPELLSSAVRWFFFGIILALMPIGVNALLVRISQLTLGWLDLLKDGELFFFSAFLTATSLGAMLAHRSSHPLIESFVLCALVLVFFIASVLYAVARYFKLNQLEPKDSLFFGKGSVVCALIAAALGFAVFLLTGGKS